MSAAANVQQARERIYTLYAIDKPVSAVQMQLALERNIQLMDDDGIKLRQSAAVSIANFNANEYPNQYTGMKVSVRDARRDVPTPDINEIYSHRADGGYDNSSGNFEAPVNKPMKTSRSRKAA